MNNANSKQLGCYNASHLRNCVCQRKSIPLADPNTIPRLSTGRLRTELLRICDRIESQDTATYESGEQVSSYSDSSDDSPDQEKSSSSLPECLRSLVRLNIVPSIKYMH